MTKPIVKGPRNNLTPQRKEIIERGARAGCTLKQIACLLGISETTLDNWVARPDVNAAYQSAKMNAILNVSDMVYNLALAGDLQAAIFYLRCRGGWRVETAEIVQNTDDVVTIYLPQNGRDSIDN